MKTAIARVSRNVGMNPVAQAVARSRLEQAVTDQKIAVYMLEEGEACAELLAGMISTMQVVLHACDADGMKSPSVNILRGGLNACFQVTLDDIWDTDQTVAVVQGLDKALELARTAKPSSISKAIKEMMG